MPGEKFEYFSGKRFAGIVDADLPVKCFETGLPPTASLGAHLGQSWALCEPVGRYRTSLAQGMALASPLKISRASALHLTRARIRQFPRSLPPLRRASTPPRVVTSPAPPSACRFSCAGAPLSLIRLPIYEELACRWRYALPYPIFVTNLTYGPLLPHSPLHNSCAVPQRMDAPEVRFHI